MKLLRREIDEYLKKGDFSVNRFYHSVIYIIGINQKGRTFATGN